MRQGVGEVDVLMDDGQGGLVIVDWKTGRSHVDETVNTQLGIYGVYAKRQLGVERIKAVHVDLRGNKYSTHSVDETQLQHSEKFVEDSASSMLESLTNPAE